MSTSLTLAMPLDRGVPGPDSSCSAFDLRSHICSTAAIAVLPKNSELKEETSQ